MAIHLDCSYFGEPLDRVLVVPADSGFPCGRRLRGDVVSALVEPGGVVVQHQIEVGDIYVRLVPVKQRDPIRCHVDNLAAHRASRIEEVAERRGAQVLWLAPCSPEFNPIEQCWSKIKGYVKVRTADALDEALAQAIRLVTKSDIRAGSSTAAIR